MDIGEEIRAAHKRDFLEFLEQDVGFPFLNPPFASFSVTLTSPHNVFFFTDLTQVGKGIYMEEIKAMINHKRHRLIINISDLHSFRDLGPRFLCLLSSSFYIVFYFIC